MLAESVPSEGCEGESSLRRPLLASGGLQAFSGILGWWKHHPSLCPHLHMVFSLRTCLWSKCPLFIKTPVILDKGPILLQYDLILINYVCKDPISK